MSKFECGGTLQYHTDESGMWSHCEKCNDTDPINYTNATSQTGICHRLNIDRQDAYLEAVDELRKHLKLYLDCVEKYVFEGSQIEENKLRELLDEVESLDLKD